MGVPVSSRVQKRAQRGNYDPPDCRRHHCVSWRAAWETNGSFRTLSDEERNAQTMTDRCCVLHLGRFHTWRETAERLAACCQINGIRLSTKTAVLQRASWETLKSQHIQLCSFLCRKGACCHFMFYVLVHSINWRSSIYGTWLFSVKLHIRKNISWLEY